MVALAARVPLMTSLLVLGLVGCNYFHPGYPLFAKDGYQERNAYHFPFLRVFPLRFLSILFSNPFHTSLSFAASNRSAKLVHGKRLKIEVLNSFCVRSMTKSTSSGFSPYTTLYSGFLAYKAAFGYLTLGGVGLYEVFLSVCP
jgi:hypothetical protein